MDGTDLRRSRANCRRVRCGSQHRAHTRPDSLARAGVLHAATLATLAAPTLKHTRCIPLHCRTVPAGMAASPITVRPSSIALAQAQIVGARYALGSSLNK